MKYRRFTMMPIYKLLLLEALIGGYVLLFLGPIVAAPLLYGRLLALYVAGTAVALFVQGPQYGTIDPISTRPLMVGLGVLLMGACLLWSFVLRSHI
jgi:hypothetical protein